MMRLLLALLLWAPLVFAANPCRELNEPCSPAVPCCAPLQCTTGTGKHCIAPTGTTLPLTSTTTTTKPPTPTTTVPAGTPTTTTLRPTTSTTLPPLSGQAVRPAGADVGQALLAGKAQFYVWYRGGLADQTIRDAMQQYVTGVILPELSRVLETACPQVISWAYRGDGALDVIYRRLGNVYENLSTIWSIGPQGRNYSNDVTALEKFRTCLDGKPEVPLLHVGLRDALALTLVGGRYVRQAGFFVFPQPPANEQIGKRAPVNVRLSFPPTGAGLTLLRNADSAHAAASGIGLFPLSVDQAARAYEDASTSRDELHFRQMKRFAGGCDARWGAETCRRWKLVQHKFFAQWTAAEERGDWRTARNADSDHQLAHICTNYMHDDLDVRFSVPGMDEHGWPMENCRTALARVAP